MNEINIPLVLWLALKDLWEKPTLQNLIISIAGGLLVYIFTTKKIKGIKFCKKLENDGIIFSIQNRSNRYIDQNNIVENEIISFDVPFNQIIMLEGKDNCLEAIDNNTKIKLKYLEKKGYLIFKVITSNPRHKFTFQLKGYGFIDWADEYVYEEKNLLILCLKKYFWAFLSLCFYITAFGGFLFLTMANTNVQNTIFEESVQVFPWIGYLKMVLCFGYAFACFYCFPLVAHDFKLKSMYYPPKPWQIKIMFNNDA